jgi:serine/threonine protein kinase
LADLKEQWNINPKMLGQGAFGKVYKATNKVDPSYAVAIKIIDKK